MEKIIQLATEDDKSDYIDLNIRILKNMDYFRKRISKKKYFISLYSILIIVLLWLIYFKETSSFFPFFLIFFLLFLLYNEIKLESSWIKRTKKIYSKEFDFLTKTTEYIITKDYIESKCEFQTLKYNWSDLTNYYEKSDEVELDFYKKGMIVLRKKSLKDSNDFINLINDIKYILKDNPIVN